MTKLRLMAMLPALAAGLTMANALWAAESAGAQAADTAEAAETPPALALTPQQRAAAMIKAAGQKAAAAKAAADKSGPVKSAAQPAPKLPTMTAAQVLDRNASARGGLAAWRAVQSISFSGAMGAGATTFETVTPKGKLLRQERPEVRLPYVLMLKRPNKSRLELDLNGQKAVQVYDGAAGWKLRPYLGRKDWEPYTADELRLAAAEPGMDGYLLDAMAHGSKVELAGTETVDGRGTYKVKVTPTGGTARLVWVDAETFLETRIEGNPRRMEGHMRAVDVYLREYRREGNLVLPHVIETRVSGIKQVEQIIVDSVAINPALDDRQFTKS